MKKLRILFLAVLATALVVSGAFAADKLPAKSFDVTKVSNGEKASTADGLVSVDLWSPDKTLTVSFDVSKLKGYDITYVEADAKAKGYTVTSTDTTVTVKLTVPSTAKSGDKFAITFTLLSTDTGSSSEGDTGTESADTTIYVHAGKAAGVTYYALTPEIINALTNTVVATLSTADTAKENGNRVYAELTDSANGVYKLVAGTDVNAVTTAVGQGLAKGSTYAILTQGTVAGSGNSYTYTPAATIVIDGEAIYATADNGDPSTATTFTKATVEQPAVGATVTSNKYVKFTKATGTFAATWYELTGSVFAKTSDAQQDSSKTYYTTDTTTDVIEVKRIAATTTDTDKVGYYKVDSGTYTPADFTKAGTYTEVSVNSTVFATATVPANELATSPNQQYIAEAEGTGTDFTLKPISKTITGVTLTAGKLYFVITPVKGTVSEVSQIAASPYLLIGEEATGTYVVAPTTEVLKASFVGYDKTNTYYTLEATKATVSSTAALEKGIYYTSSDMVLTYATSWTDAETYYTAKGTKATAIESGKHYYTSGDVSATTTSAVFDDMLINAQYAAADTKPSYTLTLTVTYRDKASTTDDEGETTGTRGIAFTSKIQNTTVTLYVSGDEYPFAGTLTVSEDFANADFSFDLLPAPKAWSFDKPVEGTSSTNTSGDVVIPYTFTLIPSETTSQDKTEYTLTAYIVGSEDEFYSELSFYVEVLVSSSKSDEEGSTEPEVSPAELKMETPVVTSTDLMQGQTAKVTITVTPQAALGTYKFAYDDADEAFTITAGSERQVSAVTGNAVEYDLQAGIEADPGKYVVTFTVTSGDQKVSADVEFTVKALSFTGMNDTEKTNYIKNNPAPKPADETTADQKAANEKAFADGAGEAKFKFRSEWPVKTKGWRLLFMRGSARNVLLNFMRWLLGGEYQYYEASMISALSIVASADNTDAITVNVGEDGYTAEYVVDVQKTASGLAKGEKFAVTPAVIPEAYDNADTANVADEVKESAGDSVGTMTGASTSDTTPGGDTPGGDTPGGDEGGEEEGDAVNFLGGSSGGCDAGFGALALALAASMIFVRKRS